VGAPTAKTPDNRFNNYGIGIWPGGQLSIRSADQGLRLRRWSLAVGYLMTTTHPAGAGGGAGETKRTDCPGETCTSRTAAAVLVQYSGLPPGATCRRRGEDGIGEWRCWWSSEEVGDRSW